MGIARAFERVKRQARQVGFDAVIEGVGEQLRSDAIPGPLRGAAWRIAALLEAACPVSGVRPDQRARELIHQDRAATGRTPERGSPELRSAEVNSSARERPMPADQRVAPQATPPAERVSPTGADGGAHPEPPVEGTPVDPALVGATPTFSAAPINVSPVDATPDDELPPDVLEETLEVDLATTRSDRSTGVSHTQLTAVGDAQLAAAREARARATSEASSDAASARDEAPSPSAEQPAAKRALDEPTPPASADAPTTSAEAPATSAAATTPAAAADAPSPASGPAASTSAQSATSTATSGQGEAKPGAKSGKRGQGARKRPASSPAPAAESASAKEKLAPAGEDAKNLARSTQRGAKRRSSAKADTSKKK